MPWETILIILVVSFASWVAVMLAFSLTSRKPTDLGLASGRLRPCPSTANCVCSQDSDSHSIAPFAFAGDPRAAWARLKEVLAKHPRTRIANEEGDWLHAECTSLVFRFVDDVEFQLGDGVIQVRSASRAGRSDLGVNRARVEALRAAFQAAAR